MAIDRNALAAEVQQHITAQVEALRSSRGLSVRALAPKVGLQYSALGHRLSGRTSWTVEDVVAIQRALGVNVLGGL